ncbi:MAG: DUF4097 family beta strand repeat-containing protein [Gemmatimonadaceae bacterium]
MRVRNYSVRVAMAAAVIAPATLPVTAAAQQRQVDTRAFEWSAKLDQGAWVRVANVNGGITVGRANGDRVEVVASKSWRRGDPKDVTVEVKRIGPNGRDVIICALYHENSTCTERGIQSRDNDGWRHRNTDVMVQFTVLLPAGLNVSTGTVNGGIRVDGATAEVKASTVNGGVEAYSSGGPVSATTVNGSIKASMSQLDGDADLRYTTVNGSVVLELPRDANADIEMRTVNGRLRTDFPIQLRGRIDPRHIEAQLGKGGRRIRITTVNGSVELRERP